MVNRKLLTLCLLALGGMFVAYQTKACAADALAAAAPASCYVKGETWGETLLASRGQYLQWRGERLRGAQPGPWLATNQAGAFAPGETISFEAQDKQEAKGKKRDRGWTRRLDFFDGRPHYNLSAGGEKISFLAREITAPKPVTVAAFVGVRDGLELYLNGEKVFSKKNLGNRLYPAPEQARVELKLAAGKNQLVLKPLGRWGGFYFSFVPRDPKNPAPFQAILDGLARDFPVVTRQLRRDVREEELVTWLRAPAEVNLARKLQELALARHGQNKKSPRAQPGERSWFDYYANSSRLHQAQLELDRISPEALRLAIVDLAKTFPGRYANADDYLSRLAALEKRLPKIRRALERGDATAIGGVAQLAALEREALLANPLLDFEKMLLIKRRPHGDPRVSKAGRGLGEFLGYPQQSSFQLHRIPEAHGWENEIATLDPARLDAAPAPLFAPAKNRLVSGLELHFDAGRLLFAMLGEDDKHWQVFEMAATGGNPRRITPAGYEDVHNFDPCYLPDGRIIYISTAPFQGVPCNPSIKVAMSYIMDADGQNIRQLTFEQDHNYYPAVMNDGRVLYLRWEYTDIPHVWGRYLFAMNPDGTGQRALYGSGAYWPNSIFFARAIPNHPSKMVGIVTGHHEGRDGQLTIIDPAQGRRLTAGIVQQIPGRGKPVVPAIEDKLTEHQFPRFMHPWPLNDKYFLVSCKPAPDDLWGIYLVDVFDNMLLLKELEGHALFEPIPVAKRPTPPVIHDRIDPTRKDALMYVENIYEGPGLEGVPPGAVKQLRVYTYHFAYDKIVGITHRVGTNGPWEPKRIMGTVPVETDGSAFFRVPANTPISMQPLDADGRALQLMRSWTTAMPGEFVSCTGCHENQNGSPLNQRTIAARKVPAEIAPWRGPVRGFSFKFEVQPVLDKYCVACHDGGAESVAKGCPDLRAEQGKYVVFKRSTPAVKTIVGVSKEKLLKDFAGVFEPSFIELRKFVRVGGLESDLRQQAPGEFHAETSELIQMLRKGHHGVQLDAEAWDRLFTWIDMNAPCHGTWSETAGQDRIQRDHDRRRDLRQLYANLNDDPEIIFDIPRQKIIPIKPVVHKNPQSTIPNLQLTGWPFGAAEAQRRQAAAGSRTERAIDLGDGVKLELVRVPAGQFVMGDSTGDADEQPLARVEIDRPFWLGRFEVTNEQFARFDADHDSRYEHAGSMIFAEENLGARLNAPRQPVVRVSWKQAAAFCDWLSAKTGEKVSLPSEAQWEYACRAGTQSPLSFGDVKTDFSPFANLADISIAKLAHWGLHDVPDLIPRIATVDDKHLVTAEVGTYQANVWGLHDMHGNVWEWTRSTYAPYPYREDDGRGELGAAGRKTVRGGSWNDRPKRCRSAFRLSYPAWQKVYNVGFRVVLDEAGAPPRIAKVSEK